jgi:hypothetical protein
MRGSRVVFWLVPVAGLCALLLGLCSASRADDKPLPRPSARQLLYPEKVEDVPEALRPYVTKLLAANQAPVEATEVKSAGVFVRVVPKTNALDGRTLNKEGSLGTRPFVFVTLPEALYGRNLLQVFSAIGYSAEDVLTGELGKEKAVLVFRWEEQVVTHTGRDGDLPEAWQTAVYPTTWNNVFALVDKMVGDRDWHYIPEGDKKRIVTKLQLRSPKEEHFLLGFPDEGKKRIRSASYSGLQNTKGADWEYRQFLERSLALTEHFSGDGSCKPTILGKDKPPVGFPEYLGPNRSLTALPEVAVIGLGALSVSEK